jgi:hypothetical protein
VNTLLGWCLIAQVRLSEVTCHRNYKRYRSTPMLAELTPLDTGSCAIGILWCGSWRAHSAALTHINFLDENSTVMTAANDGLVRLWDEEVCVKRLWLVCSRLFRFFVGVAVCDQGRLLGTLDPNPRHQPAPPHWLQDVEGDRMSVGSSDAVGENDDTFSGTPRWHTDHITSVRVYDDENPEDVFAELGLRDIVFNAGTVSSGTTPSSVYITQMVPSGPSLTIDTEIETPRELTTEELLSPKKTQKRDAVKTMNRMLGYRGVVIGGGVRVVLLSERKRALQEVGKAHLPHSARANPLDRPGLKHVGFAPKRGKVVWFWEPDLESRYVVNVAEAKEVLGMGRVMAMAARWKSAADDTLAEKR